MARTWLRIRVDLRGGGGIPCDPPPGRIFIVGPSHSFADVAEAIDSAFARWDRGHLHCFEMADGRRNGYPDDAFGLDPGWCDHARLTVVREVRPGDAFEYTFDLGDDWCHVGRVETEKVDPVKEYGQVPGAPVAIWGWGAIPDHYGRDRPDDD